MIPSPGLFFSLGIRASNSCVQFRRVFHQIALKVLPGFNQRKGLVRTASHHIGVCIVLPIIFPAAKIADLKFTKGSKRWIPTTGQAYLTSLVCSFPACAFGTGL
jgi:hypothetical protein